MLLWFVIQITGHIQQHKPWKTFKGLRPILDYFVVTTLQRLCEQEVLISRSYGRYDCNTIWPIYILWCSRLIVPLSNMLKISPWSSHKVMLLILVWMSQQVFNEMMQIIGMAVTVRVHVHKTTTVGIANLHSRTTMEFRCHSPTEIHVAMIYQLLNEIPENLLNG